MEQNQKELLEKFMTQIKANFEKAVAAKKAAEAAEKVEEAPAPKKRGRKKKVEEAPAE